MPYTYLEHGPTADATFRAWGRDLDELFIAAADATANLMVEALASIAPAVRVPVAVRAEGLDLLLVHFLDELLFHKDARRLLLRARDVHVTADQDGAELKGTFEGEPIDARKHALAADPKAVTLYGLRVERTASGWEAEVTVDV